MILELHIIQNFAPSNLNRDENNTPKDCIFGGYRRARISSQCVKRSVRKHFAFTKAVEEAGGDLGVRTKRLKDKVFVEEMIKKGKSPEEARIVAANIITLIGLKFKNEEKTQYILYLGNNEINDMLDIALSNWKELAAVEIKADGEDNSETQSNKRKGKEKKLKVPEKLQPVQKELVAVVGGGKKSYAADVALFGRMIADKNIGNMNVDAACQVAHAISTNKVDMETDFFTAVDDLLPEEESGSDMIGAVEFNSSCFYRYSLLDLKKLSQNLGFNDDLLKGVVRGYIEGSIKAVPTGKQNSMAAQNPVSFVRAILRKDGFPWNLSNAFEDPVRPTNKGKTLTALTIERLNGYFNELTRIYGNKGIACDVFFDLKDENTVNMDTLCERITEAVETLKEELKEERERS